MSDKLKIRIMILGFAIVASMIIGFEAKAQTTSPSFSNGASPNTQSFSNDPKFVAIMPTQDKPFEIKIKNEYNQPLVFLVYRYKPGDSHWKRIGSVTIWKMSECKFYVESGYRYGYNLEDQEPIKIGSDEKKWRVRYSRRDRGWE